MAVRKTTMCSRYLDQRNWTKLAEAAQQFLDDAGQDVMQFDEREQIHDANHTPVIRIIAGAARGQYLLQAIDRRDHPPAAAHFCSYHEAGTRFDFFKIKPPNGCRKNAPED